MLILNIGASLLAFYAFIMFLDGVVGWFGQFAGWDELSFSYILGYLLYPVAFLIGIEAQVLNKENLEDPSLAFDYLEKSLIIQFKDCKIIGELIGQKILITEFPAFLGLRQYYDDGEISERSFKIATYALCGFANFPSIGIQIGGTCLL